MERTTNGIERLASLMGKMDTKLDRKDYQYRPRIYQGRGRGCGYRLILPSSIFNKSLLLFSLEVLLIFES